MNKEESKVKEDNSAFYSQLLDFVKELYSDKYENFTLKNNILSDRVIKLEVDLEKQKFEIKNLSM